MLLSAFSLSLLAASTVRAGVVEQLVVSNGINDEQPLKVPVVLGVMSQCPDAILCEKVFDTVLELAGDKTDISLSFIGKINPHEPDFGVTCLHGPGECAGNVQELCAFKYAPRETWWKFVQCQNARGRLEVGKPATALKCAAQVGLDWILGGTGVCAGLDGSGKGKEGIQLLQESVHQSEELHIKSSCSILINGKTVCVHDGTWKNCDGGHEPEDFVKRIEDEFKKINKRK
jgi:hypothetical protein